MKYCALLSLLFLLAACQTDETRKKGFAGQYQVTLHVPKAAKEMEAAEKEVEKELSRAQDEIEEGIAEAKEDIEAELGEENHLGNAVGNFVEGIGGLAQGLAKLGEGLGKMGINLGQSIVDGLRFKVEFKEDGNVYFGKKSRIQIGSSEGNFWDIKDGTFYLWENENEKTAFEMKDLGNGDWELVNEDIIFHLERLEK